MARKKTPSLPVSPVQGKRFWLDPKMRERKFHQWIPGRGGTILSGLDATLDYLVLAESWRSRPGQSPAERKAAKLSGAKLAILYENDLPDLLLPSSEEALAVLQAEAAGNKRWCEMLPPEESPWKIDLIGADLSGLELISFDLRNCDFDFIQLRGTNLDKSAIMKPCNVDFRRIKLPIGLYVGSPERCNFAGMVLGRISVYDPVACDFTEADLSSMAIFGGWETTDLVAERAIFHDAKLPESRLHHARLRGANFTQAYVAESEFNEADLRDANCEGADMHGASFRNADLRQVCFVNANLGSVDFTGAKITGADFTGANVHNTKGLPAKLVKQIQPGTWIMKLEAVLAALASWQLDFALALKPTGRVNVQLQWDGKHISQVVHKERLISHSGTSDLVAALRELAVEYRGATPMFDTVKLMPDALATKLDTLPLLALAEAFGQPISNATQAAATQRAAADRTVQTREELITGLSQGKAGIERWNKMDSVEREAVGGLQKIDLSRCDLTGVNLRRVNCRGGNFEKANLSRADLVLATFHRVNFKGAKLKEVEADCVRMASANLEGANLRGGKFPYSGFQKANLRSADLTGADMKHANLKGADLTGAVLTNVNFEKAHYDVKTIFPQGFQPIAAGMLLR
jgi:uncharacterized protein YjbI with pentapeptide repeats